MDLWLLKKWKVKYSLENQLVKTGMRLHFDKNVDTEVKRAHKEFAKWIRSNFHFPVRVNVYVKASYRVRCLDGDFACSRSVIPYDINEEPYISLATGDYEELKENDCQDNALASLLLGFAQELSHYYQWINDEEERLTPRGVERQATYYARKRLDEYKNTREHP